MKDVIRSPGNAGKGPQWRRLTSVRSNSVIRSRIMKSPHGGGGRIPSPGGALRANRSGGGGGGGGEAYLRTSP